MSLFSGEYKAIGAAIFLTAIVQTNRVVHTAQIQIHDDEVMLAKHPTSFPVIFLCLQGVFTEWFGSEPLYVYIYIERLFQAPFVSLLVKYS